MTFADLCALLDVGKSTGAAKAREVSKAMDLFQFHPDWTLPSMRKYNPLLRFQQIGGLIVPKPEENPERLELIETYRRLRHISTDLQTILANQVIDGEAAEIAVRLGLAKNVNGAAKMDFNDVAPVLDLTLFLKGADGHSLVDRYLEEAGRSPTPEAKRVVVAMTRTWFSVFAMVGWHPVAGVNLIDMTTGEEHGVMDLGFEASMSLGYQVAIRLFQPADFHITTGVAVSMNSDAIWDAVEQRHALDSHGDDLLLVGDRDEFAEAIYAAAAEVGALVKVA